jgi:hypothetical protein
MSDDLKKLREPFPPEAISKLPKGVSKEGTARQCDICGGFHRAASVHLDYVGHAAITDRLLTVDPEWFWEPFALDDRGAPLMVYSKEGWPIGLWIRLTVAGMTRIGYGSCEPGKTEAVKELIGDALRNAGMRFGMALELWHKGELPQEDGPPPPEPVRIDLDIDPAAWLATAIEALGLWTPEQKKKAGTAAMKDLGYKNPLTKVQAEQVFSSMTAAYYEDNPDALPF